MTRLELDAKLNRNDISGTGVEVTTANGNKIYYFYENFETESDGIERAMNHLYPQLNKGIIEKVAFISKSN